MKVQEQKKHSRRLERQAKANSIKLRNDSLREAGLTEQSKAVKKDQKGKARRLSEACRNGRKLCPAAYTKFMEREQDRCKPK